MIFLHKSLMIALFTHGLQREVENGPNHDLISTIKQFTWLLVAKQPEVALVEFVQLPPVL